VSRFRAVFGGGKPIIGVIHLPALPGYPQSPGLDGVLARTLRDVEALERGGVQGILVENDDDRPMRIESAPETTAVMTRATREAVVAASRAAVGIETLLNDPMASLAVAKAAGAAFIRTDYFVDPMERPEHGGTMAIDPEGLIAYRRDIGAEDVLILADIQVKYATMMVERSLAESAALAADHGADGIIVSGLVTGQPPDIAQVAAAKQGAGTVPVLIGSGTDADNAAALLAVADGAIVGTSLKDDRGIVAARVAELVSVARDAGGRP
jgi:membrane complex biogenesis BtpA family protein